jgi:hypothetical protein
MRASQAYRLLDAAPAIHSAACDSWNAGTPVDQGLPDDVVAYAVAARRVYSELRRLVGQIAGLLILAQASNRREALDLPALAGANELWQATPELFERLSPPRRLDVHLYRLKSAHALLGDCLSSLRSIALRDGGVDLTDALAKLSQAYSHLQLASEPRVGMSMVDFSAACCNCGQPNSTTNANRGG